MTATWPGSALLYKKMVERIRAEDWEIEYSESEDMEDGRGGGGRFGFMGNGFLEFEEREGDEVDFAWYIEVPPDKA